MLQNHHSYLARRLLLVEDNPGDAELIQDLIEVLPSPRPELVHVTRLDAAEPVLRAGQLDAVLLDLRLPDAEGVAVVRAVRAWASELPIVILTGMDDDVMALSCLAAGAQDYLAKAALTTAELRRAVAYAMARVQEAKQRRRADSLQQHLAAIVESTGELVVSVDLDGCVLSWNRGATQILGYTAEEAIGCPVTNLLRVHEGDPPLLLKRGVGELIGTGAEEDPAELVALRKDGARVSLSLVHSWLRDGAGRVIGLAGIAQDVTESRRRDEELRRRNAELLARDQQMRALTLRLNAVREEERTRVSREVHDELGQLLTGVKMDLRWVARRLVPAELASAPTLIARLTEAETLIDTMIAAVQRIAIELRPSTLDTLGLPAAIRDEARRFQQRTGVAMHLDVVDASPADGEAATALFRIYQELLTNVARHAQAKNVSVALEEADVGWRLRIEDDGVGMRLGAQQDASSLGLLGMKERAVALGGRISLEPAPIRGTIATIEIPER